MKAVFRNTDLPLHLSGGGILLMMAIRPLLLVHDMIEKGGALSMGFFLLGIAAILAGGILRLYQQKQARQPYLQNFAFRIFIGLALTFMMMATGIIHTPSFILEWLP